MSECTLTNAVVIGNDCVMGCALSGSVVNVGCGVCCESCIRSGLCVLCEVCCVLSAVCSVLWRGVCCNDPVGEGVGVNTGKGTGKRTAALHTWYG